MVDDAAAGCSGARKDAIERFLVRYRRPLYLHLKLRHRLDSERADEILQGFLVNKILEKNLVALADPNRGRFRTFLLTVLDRYLGEVRRLERARRRARAVSLDVDGCESADDGSPTPPESFDIAWAREVVDQALLEMRAECRRMGRDKIWEVFRVRLLRPIFEGMPPPSYAQLVDEFGFTSPTQASNVLVTAKRTFERSLRAVIGQYEKGEPDIRSEVDDLIKILVKASAGSPRV
jgi:RNA polymerase sigma-70 factor (ECF subfamily)